MKSLIIPGLLFTLLLSSCKKEDHPTNVIVTPPVDFKTLESDVLTDFVAKVALPSYADLKSRAVALNSRVIELDNNTTEANLENAKNAWKDLRSTWEKCEGFLFGPVDKDEHDPETDTWPVNFVDLDALLGDNSNNLEVSDIEGLSNRALKGYHPIEYILWGTSTKPQTATDLNADPRKKKYILSLTEALKKQAVQLFESWSATGGNYADQVIKAGNGSSEFTTKQSAFIVLLEGFLGICDEVANGKMKDPFTEAAIDPSAGALLVESPFSGNSITDFKNNITGAYNVYLGKYNEDGKGMNDLVVEKNINLDKSIRQKFEAAIASFDNITVPYERAIKDQRIQCQNVMNSINALAAILDGDLRNFIVTNITD